MKKQLLTLLIAFTLVLSGCQINSDANATDPQPDTQSSTLDPMDNQNTTSPPIVGPSWSRQISFKIENLDELDNYKAVLEEKDEIKVQEQLYELSGWTTATKEEVARFVEVIPDIQYLDLIDGEMSYITYDKSYYEDTSETNETVYVIFNASDGSWIRFEYFLSEEPPQAPDDIISLTAQGFTVLSEPIEIDDGNVKLFIEKVQDHPSGVGTMYFWFGNINGKMSEISYYVPNEELINTEAFFANASVLKVYDETE